VRRLRTAALPALAASAILPAALGGSSEAAHAHRAQHAWVGARAAATHGGTPAPARSGGVAQQLASTLRAIRALSGYTPCVFRPPYGDYDAEVVRVARALGLAMVLWNVDPADYTLPGTAAIEQRVLAQVQPGAIVLSHDGGGPRGQTLAAYPAIIRALRTRGYRFVTVPQLLGFHPIYRRCRRDCEGAGVSGPLPRGAIVRPG
jgi:peptidoglycan/xylan/chitin deacetylase (PgdA/CDA1 family)